MAKKAAIAIHCIYLAGLKEPIAPGEEFSAEAEVVDDLIENGAAAKPEKSKKATIAALSAEPAGGSATGDEGAAPAA